MEDYQGSPQGPQESVTATMEHSPSRLLVPNPAVQDSPLEQSRPGMARQLPSHLPAPSPPWEWPRAKSLPSPVTSEVVHWGAPVRETGRTFRKDSWSLRASLPLLGLSFPSCAMSQLLWVTKASFRSPDLHDSCCCCSRGWPYF